MLIVDVSNVDSGNTIDDNVMGDGNSDDSDEFDGSRDDSNDDCPCQATCFYMHGGADSSRDLRPRILLASAPIPRHGIRLRGV